MFDLLTPLDGAVGVAYHLVIALSAAVGPAFGGGATAAAIVLFTAGVRLALVPLSYAQIRGERARATLRPQILELQKRHKNNPQRLQRELAELHRAEGVSPLAGCLPILLQWPVFAVVYRLFLSSAIGGQPNALLAHNLLGTPLGASWLDVLSATGPFGPHGLVFLVLFGLLGLVAWWSSRRLRDQTPAGGIGTVLRLLPYGAIAVAAVVPLASGLYLLTTTAWTALERAVLARGIAPAAGAPAGPQAA